MLVEPDLDRAALAAVLQRGYGLTASVVRFVPAGETSWCYQVTDERGGRWFLKLGRPGAIEGARAELALQLCDALAGLGLAVPRPRPTQAGELWCWLDGLRVAVFEFIDGRPLSDQDLGVPEVARQTARLVAAVHAATPALVMQVPFWVIAELGQDPGGQHHPKSRLAVHDSSVPHARLSAPRTPADRLVPCDVDALILVLRLALLTGW